MDGLLDHLLDDEDRIFKLLTDLKYEKYGALNNIIELIKLKTQFYHKNNILIMKD